MFNKNNLTVRVDFPALDNLLAFLRENQQAEIDALTNKVGSLTTALKKSNTNLSQAIATESKS